MVSQSNWKFIEDLKEEINKFGLYSFNSRTQQKMKCVYGRHFLIHPKLFYGKFNKKHYRLNYDRIWFEEDSILEKFKDETTRQGVIPMFYASDISIDHLYHTPNFVPPCIMHIRLERISRDQMLAFSTIRSSNIEMLKSDILFIGDIIKKFCRKLETFPEALYLNIENSHIYVNKKSRSV